MNNKEESILYLLKFRHSRMAWLILCVALLVTAGLWRLSVILVKDRTLARFENQSEQLKTAIEERLLNYEQVLAASVGLFEVAGEVSQEDWARYIKLANIDRYYPGIQGIGFAKYLSPQDYSVIYLEPSTEKNKRAIGFNAYSDAQHRSAIDYARQTGQAAITGKVVLVQEDRDTSQAAFLLYFPVNKQSDSTKQSSMNKFSPVNQQRPVYENDAQLPSESASPIKGYVFSAFRMNNLMDGIVGLISPFLDIRIYDSDVIQEERVMYDSGLGTLDNSSTFSRSQSIKFGGRTWLLETRTTPAFDYLASDPRPNIVLGFGVVISLLLFLMALILIRGKLLAMVGAGRYRAITEDTNDMTVIIGEKGIPTYISPSCERLTGYDYIQVRKTPPEQIIHPDDFPALNKTIEDVWAAGKGRSEPVSFRLRTLNNGCMQLEGVFTSMVGVPGVDGIVGNFRDVSALKMAEMELKKLAYYDVLTGLANRQLFKDRLAHAIKSAKRRNVNAAVMFIDLDGFKGINDSLGHDAGDDFLKMVASWIVDCVRQEDSVARIGGDEFTVLLSEVSGPEAVAQVADNILHAIKQKVRIRDHEVFVSGSIGIAMIPADSEDESSLMKYADLAMYRAKEIGKDNYQFFTSNLNIRAAKRLLLQEELRAALDNEQFVLVYQPKVDIAAQKIVGLEALIRWQHPEKGLIEPDEFIDVAEESGLIHAIGEWGLRKICIELKVLLAEFSGLHCAINFSRRQLMDHRFFKMLDEVLAITEVDPSCLEFEVPSDILMDQNGNTRQILNELSNRKIDVVLDDFGTGYCSLSMMQDFPVKAVKIDQTLVQDLMLKKRCSEVTLAVISIARDLGLDVIAEGVETQEQFQYLKENQCQFAQGHLFCPPIRESQLPGFLTNYEGQSKRYL